jgi:hypothetical protein
MNMLRGGLGGALCVAAALLLAGCGGKGGSGTVTPANVRLINATQDAALGVNVTGSAWTLSGVPPGGASAYLSVTPASYTIDVATADGALTPSTAQTLTLAAGTNYTILATTRDSAISTVTYADNQAAPATGYLSFRVSNATGDAGPVDVYLVATGTTSLAGLAPTFTYVNSGALSSIVTITPGTYRIVVTALGNPNDVRLVLPGITFAAGQILTLALTSTSGGALVNGVLVDQGQGVQTFANDTRRVRVVAGIAAGTSGTNSNVVATVGGTALATIVSPSVGAYTVLPAGANTLAVTIDGTAVTAVPAQTFAAGGDYTVLVYNTAAAPAVAVFTDDNQSPGYQANMRLVNAAVPTGGLSLAVNYTTAATGIGYGATSSYVGVAPANSELVQVSSPTTTFVATPNPLTNVNVASSGVYTVFVLGATGSAIVQLAKDR